ncbi:4Fe-4S dicluster domain-containing protein [Pseudodesulfovibrio tunisiensis]|uniref:4Fe-4S dicluster domain-containing protein n=1 Tax=Pseudodesulfovibrio tunisiensis TaxID=463192 RepID=UPI001FB3906B|nr:4Fe-4S dicluster domain-containing protein [Pseudodesulfovibrio tunisiensis]
MNTHETHPLPPHVELTLMRHCPLVTCGQEVRRGERVATSSVPDMGDIHTPIAGKVSQVDAFRVRITAEGNAEVEPEDLRDISGAELRTRLAGLGADLAPIPEAGTDFLIINAVDAEPGVLARQELLSSSRATLERGLEAVIALYAPSRTVLATLKGSGKAFSDTESAEISEQYPAGLDPMVAYTVTGVEAPDKTVVLGLEILFHVGRIMETGLPVMETMVTLGNSASLVPLGTPAGLLLEKTGQKPGNLDRIVLGGVLRGTAAASPMQGVARNTSAISVVTNEAPVAVDSPCVGCGECVRHCPARLDPAMITSYAEFGMYDKAAAEHVEACFECGLCGFFCIARRPMLQYIRLAKSELARAKALTAEEN